MQSFISKLFFAFCLIIICLSGSHSNAQFTAGITNKRDTSYSTYNAYKYDKPYFPNISIVPEFNYDDIDVKKDINYCTVGTHHLMIDAFTPKKSSGKTIAVIMVHGGGWRTGNRTQHYPLAESLAHLGYACFTPEYRLSTEALFPAAVYDVKAAIRWVKANANTYNVDTSKIVIAGFSAGGELAAFISTTGNMSLFDGNEGEYTNYSTNVNATINIDGTLSFTHPESGENIDSIGRISAGTYWFGYTRAQNEGLWLVASPLTYASHCNTPTLFLNSSVDRMHAGRNDFIKVLDTNHIYTEVHRFENSPHSFPLYSPFFDPMIKYMDGFLKKVFVK
jgi:acetyl esterase/lipase